MKLSLIMVKIKNSLFSFVTGFLLGVVFSFVFLDHSTDVLILFGIAGGLVMVILFTIFRWVIQMAVKNTSNHLNIDKSFFWSLFSLFFFCIIYFVMYFLWKDLLYNKPMTSYDDIVFYKWTWSIER